MDIKISLKAARVNADMTQDDVARELGVSNKTVLNWETGKTTPSPATVKALADLYRMPLNNIFLPNDNNFKL